MDPVRREGLGHESNFHERLCVGLKISVENVVNHGPVIHRVAFGVFGVSVGGSPFQTRGSISCRKKKVRSQRNRGICHGRQFADKSAAVARIGVVWLVIPKKSVDGFEWGNLL